MGEAKRTKGFINIIYNRATDVIDIETQNMEGKEAFDILSTLLVSLGKNNGIELNITAKPMVEEAVIVENIPTGEN